MKLYSYWRSSASYRVRIALALKGLKAEIVPVNLLKGEQKGAPYAKINPERRVPALMDGGEVLTQSLSIIEYLEEQYPAPPLLPLTPRARARVRALAQIVAGDISPLNNLGPMQFLGQQFGLTQEQKNQWHRHWVIAGFAALEQMLEKSSCTGTFCHGAEPTMADCFLVPQVYNARRYHLDLSPYPVIARIDAACAEHPAFIAAHPVNQKDAA